MKKGGETLWVKLTVSPVGLEAGTLRTHLTIIEDVTEQRSVTEQLQQEQKLESLGRLAGGIAPDFNTLLTAILATTEVLKIDAVEGSGANLEDLEAIIGAAERAPDLTGQLLSFARRPRIAPVILDINAVIQTCERMLRRLVREDVEVTATLAPSPCLGFADPGQLEQVIMNLAVNAQDAMPRGGTLQLETRAVGGGWVELVVRDSGTGMSAEEQKHLFEPCFTTKEPGKGTGLGLATVYGIVTRAGGTVWVRSEPGAGTTVQILLPQAPSGATVIGADPTGSEVGGSELVLVVEDEVQVQQVTVRALTAAGSQVLNATRPREVFELSDEALSAVRSLVTDVVMPGLEGHALAAELHMRNPALKVLYVSGYTPETLVERGGASARVELLTKPFTGRALLKRVRAVLGAAG